MKRKIIIADDHPMIHKGLINLFEFNIGDAEIFSVYDAVSLINELKSNIYDLVILDIEIPDNSGISFFEQLMQIYPKLKCIIFSYFDEEIYGIKYLKAGAYAYVSKSWNSDIIIKAVKLALNNEKFLTNKQINLLTNNVISENPFSQLTSRELDVAALLYKGLDLIEIGKKLFISASTVSTYKLRIYEKLNAKNIIDFVKIYELCHS